MLQGVMEHDHIELSGRTFQSCFEDIYSVGCDELPFDKRINAKKVSEAHCGEPVQQGPTTAANIQHTCRPLHPCASEQIKISNGWHRLHSSEYCSEHVGLAENVLDTPQR